MYKKTALVMLVCAFFIRFGMAQTTGTISGFVKDTSGAVVPGAMVAAKNVETGISRSAITDEQGRYQFPNLSVGEYEVQVSLSGFQTDVRRGVELTVGRQAVVNFALQVGQIAQTVEVTGEAPVVETTNGTITGLVDQNTIRDLPLNGRSFTEMLTLQIGTVFGRQDAGATGGGALGGGPKVSVSGARPGQNSYLLDGTDMNDSRSAAPGGAAGLTLGVETVREFRVLTNAYSAEYGRSSGGVLTAVTKSGTNDLHGTLFEFLRNSKLDANTWDSTARGNGVKAPFKRNQFGLTLGGPIKQNQTFFFGSYEGLVDRLGGNNTINVPTARAKQGFMPQNGTIGAPEVPVPGGIRPAVKPWLALYPDPNGPILDYGNGTGQYSYVTSQPTDENYFSGRIDHRFSSNHSIFGRYTIDDSDRVSPTRPLPDRQHYTARNQYLTVAFDSIFSPTTLNTARFGMNRSNSLQHQVFDSSFDQNTMTFVPGQPFGLGGALTVAGNAPIALIGNVRLPAGTLYRLFEGSDDVTLIRGSHTLKTGMIYKKISDLETAVANEAGSYSFNTTGLWDFLQGNPTQFQLGWPPLHASRDWRQDFWGLYLQDDFKWRPNLTLNLGVREEFMTSPNEAKGQCANVTDVMQSVPTVGCPFFKTSKNNWAPRVGFAWDTKNNSKFVLRGGFGMFYDQPFPTYWRALARDAPPYALNVIITPQSTPSMAFGNSANYLNFNQPPPPQAPLEIRSYKPTGTSYLMQYNLNIQSEIRPGTGVMVGYVGSQGRKLPITRSVDTLAWQILPDGRRQFSSDLNSILNPTWSSDLEASTVGNSSYSAMVFTVNQSFRGGLRAQASYTYAKLMSVDDTVFGADFGGGDSTQGVMDAYNVRRDWGPATYGLRHNLVVNYSYALPIKSEGWKRRLIEGWELSGITARQSGVPFSATTAFRPDNPNAVWRPGQLRPDLIPGMSNNPISGVTAGCTVGTAAVPAGLKLGTPDLYFDPCAFSNPQRGFYGNLGRNTLTGPGLFNVDFSLQKNTAITEKTRLQFRAEFFNILNHPNFSTPSAGIFDTRGNLFPAVLKRQQITTTVTRPRQIQLALKLVF
jgi:hypothetical protein